MTSAKKTNVRKPPVYVWQHELVKLNNYLKEFLAYLACLQPTARMRSLKHKGLLLGIFT